MAISDVPPVAHCLSSRRICKWQESFFHTLKVSLKIWLMMIQFWSINFLVTKVATQAKIVECWAIAFYQWLWDVCSWKLLQTQIVLGGQNRVVHIDESLQTPTKGKQHHVSQLLHGDDIRYLQRNILQRMGEGDKLQ